MYSLLSSSPFTTLWKDLFPPSTRNTHVTSENETFIIRHAVCLYTLITSSVGQPLIVGRRYRVVYCPAIALLPPWIREGMFHLPLCSFFTSDSSNAPSGAKA